MKTITAVLALIVATLLTGCEHQDPLDPSFVRSMGAATVTAPSNLTASAASNHQVSLAWQDNSTNEDGWEVHRSTTGPTGTYALLTVYAGPNITQGGNDGLQSATQYCYKVRAYRGPQHPGSYSGFSNVACATTLTGALPAPSNVSATPDAGSSIKITWTDNSADENGFIVERASPNDGPWYLAVMRSANIVSFTDQRPSVEQPACYRVFSFNNSGTSEASSFDCTAIPAAPCCITATVTGSDVNLVWEDNSGVEDGFELLRAVSGGMFSVVATLPANTTAYRDEALADNAYDYHVRATKDGGTSALSYHASAVVASVPPAAPSGIHAAPTSSSTITITWVDNSNNETGFRAERTTDGGASWVYGGAASFNQTAFYVAGLASEQPACYRIIAFNGLGESPPSSFDCATPPAAPSELVATTAGGGSIDLTWTDNSAVEDGYEVQQVVCYDDEYYGYQCDHYAIVTLGPNATSYRHSGLTAGFFVYQVVALKDGARSDPSNQAGAWSDLTQSHTGLR